MRRRWFMTLAVAALCACTPKQEQPELVERAVFGVFFGGQVQELSAIPFEIDRKKQTQGLRIDFAQPLAAPAKIHWEFDRPAPRGKRPSPTSRVTQLGDAEARAGSERFEVPLELLPGDPLGEWNVRALVDDQLVIDQRFEVYSPASRAAKERALEDDE